MAFAPKSLLLCLPLQNHWADKRQTELGSIWLVLSKKQTLSKLSRDRLRDEPKWSQSRLFGIHSLKRSRETRSVLGPSLSSRIPITSPSRNGRFLVP